MSAIRSGWQATRQARRGLAFLGAVALALVLAGCGPSGPSDVPPEMNGSCGSEESATCQDRTALLECHQGVYRSVPCKGPLGCTTFNSGFGVDAICDISFNDVGDLCLFSEEDHSFCTAFAGILVCRDGVFDAGPTCPNGCVGDDATHTARCQ